MKIAAVVGNIGCTAGWMAADLGVFVLSYLAAVVFGNDFHFYYDSYGKLEFCIRFFRTPDFWILAGGQCVFFYLCGMYRRIWGYANFRDVVALSLWCAVYNAFFALICETVYRDAKLPNGLYPILCIFDIALLVTIRMWNQIRILFQTKEFKSSGIKTMIVGAGMGGRELLFNIRRTVQDFVPVVFIDDDVRKHGLYLNGLPIHGGRDKIAEAVAKYRVKSIILAIPSIDERSRQEIINVCVATGCKVHIVPSAAEIVNGKVSINQLRDVEVEDLLGREQTLLDIGAIRSYVEDKVVLVTGGGGSIGSELCRQLARYRLRHLVIFDIYENNAYDIEQELRREHPELPLTVLIGSIRDAGRLEDVFRVWHPEIVFHAAAHKHVPLMEESPFEAMKNNCLGTLNVARAAKKFNARRFIQISTDKAVYPTNVMGCSKRLCEMIIQSMNEPGKTEFVAVRFGNVLGSNGSVIPLFKKQIARRKPVTVTHPEITRYFMTIPEAARLVIQAGALAGGGEIFILNMGKPFKILTLAENLIRLSGLRPYEDIPIEFCGLRPGEKLYEELSLAEEGMTPSAHDQIFISNPIPFDRDKLEAFLRELPDLIASGDRELLIRTLKAVVPTFYPERAGEWRRQDA